MNDEKFIEADKIADYLYGEFVKLHDAGHLNELKNILQNFSKNLSERYSISTHITLDIFDSEREKQINIFQTGFSCIGNDKPYQTNAGDAFNRYMVNGCIVELPDSYCPNCWSEWGFKKFGQSCKSCDLIFGREIKLLLDTNECPNCKKGTISLKNPYCDSCEFYADPNLVIWG